MPAGAREPPLAHVDCGSDSASNQTPRHDLTIVHLRNTGASPARVTPTLTIESASPIQLDPSGRRVQIGGSTSLTASSVIAVMEKGAGRAMCRFPETVIPPHGEQVLSFVVARGRNAVTWRSI